MKKILITQRVVLNDTYYEVRESLDIKWGELFKTLGFLPIILPYEMNFEEYFNNIQIDGILLTGGNDLNSLKNNDLSFKRDSIEKKLIQYGIDHDLPIFGVCRGLQVIAEYFGATFQKVENQVNVKQKLKVNKESKYFMYLNNLDEVNSFHNFAVHELNNELRISAYGENNIVKAIEHKKYKIFAQMWHSERETPFKKDELILLKNFFDVNIEDVINIAKKAGKVIMDIYNRQNINIKIKDDTSPVTDADLEANEIIVNGLKAISNYPIVTEEMPVEYSIREKWDKFWLVDPLDGTKDFLAKNGEFTVNIALIKKNKPILGVIYLPFSDIVYSAMKNVGAYKNGNRIYNDSMREDLIGSDSNFHSNSAVKDFFEKYAITKIKKYGSAIKFCKLAEGEIDVYPRLNGTKEWDTAAGHIIANEAGCKLVDVTTKGELFYNKKDIKNNYFIASRNDLEFKI